MERPRVYGSAVCFPFLQCELIPFRVNNSAYTYFVGGASCPAGLARSQGFLLYSTQTPLLDPRSQCTIILEKWYYYRSDFRIGLFPVSAM